MNNKPIQRWTITLIIEDDGEGGPYFKKQEILDWLEANQPAGLSVTHSSAFRHPRFDQELRLKLYKEKGKEPKDDRVTTNKLSDVVTDLRSKPSNIIIDKSSNVTIDKSPDPAEGADLASGPAVHRSDGGGLPADGLGKPDVPIDQGRVEGRQGPLHTTTDEATEATREWYATVKETMPDDESRASFDKRDASDTDTNYDGWPSH